MSQSSSKGKLQPQEEQGVESFIKHRNDQAFGEEHKHQHDCPSKGDKETSISNMEFLAASLQAAGSAQQPQDLHLEGQQQVEHNTKNQKGSVFKSSFIF